METIMSNEIINYRGVQNPIQADLLNPFDM